ncbi:MAG: LemA family protein [Candidatus Bathyarchaeia archaeon]
MKKKTIIWIIVGVVILLVAWVWTSYNRLVTMSEQVDGQWAQVEVQYQRRFDLIPNLVEAVKGAMSQEESIFGDLAAARQNYAGANTVNAKAEAASQLEGALGRLLAIMENYPELKSIESVQTLMAQLEGTENRVSVERTRFNDGVRNYNIVIKRFPMKLIASSFSYFEKAYFEVSEIAAEAPKVDFNLGE